MWPMGPFPTHTYPKGVANWRPQIEHIMRGCRSAWSSLWDDLVYNHACWCYDMFKILVTLSQKPYQRVTSSSPNWWSCRSLTSTILLYNRSPIWDMDTADYCSGYHPTTSQYVQSADFAYPQLRSCKMEFSDFFPTPGLGLKPGSPK